ncbi:HXXEE domain-containing protein [Niabella aquatica]
MEEIQKQAKRVLLFPATYLIHIAEEYWFGERFFNWLNHFAGARMTANSFLVLNAICLIIMIAACVIALYRRDIRIPLVLAGIILSNALLHLIGSIVTNSYSPGLVSALLLWLPLSLRWLLRYQPTVSTPKKISCLAAGILIQVMVSFLALKIQ